MALELALAAAMGLRRTFGSALPRQPFCSHRRALGRQVRRRPPDDAQARLPLRWRLPPARSRQDASSFVAALIAMELASCFVLYSTAFVAIVQIGPVGAQRSITHLTLIAGFASTLFWPLTSLLHEHLDMARGLFDLRGAESSALPADPCLADAPVAASSEALWPRPSPLPPTNTRRSTPARSGWSPC